MMRSIALVCVSALLVASSHADTVAKSAPTSDTAPARIALPLENPGIARMTEVVSRSPWRERSQETWAKQLANTKADLIVVPFEEASGTLDASLLAWLEEASKTVDPSTLVDASTLALMAEPTSTFDTSTRALMAATLAWSLSARGVAVLDPYLVANALGDPSRRYDSAALDALATKVGATRIVRGFVEVRRNQFIVTLVVDTVPLDESKRTLKTLTDLRFDAAHTAMDELRDRVPEFLETFPPTSNKREKPATRWRAPGPSFDVFAFSTPFEGSAEQAALRLQVLGALTPHTSDRLRRSYFERSLLALEQTNRSGAQYRALKARALLRLGYRPEALSVLGGRGKSPEEQELYAAANGNLPEIEKAASKLDGTALLFALLDANELRWEYEAQDRGRALSAAGEVTQRDPMVDHLVRMQFLDRDCWRETDSERLLEELEDKFPVAGLDRQMMAKSAELLGRRAPVSDALAVQDHWTRWMAQNAASLCCGPTAYPTATDYLALLVAHDEANLLCTIDRALVLQGLPRSALQIVESTEIVYAGHPGFEVRRAEALASMAQEVDGIEHDALMRRSMRAAYDAYFWEQGRTETAARALRLLGPNEPGSEYGVNLSLFNDNPPYPPYTVSFGGTEEEAARQLEYSIHTFDAALPLLGMLEAQGKPTDSLMSDLASRFQGNPARELYFAERDLAEGRETDARVHYQAAVDAQPANWTACFGLAAMLVRQADYAGAAKLLESYKGGIAKGEPLEVSNYASQAGHLFYWRGQLDVARRFYEMAVASGTGAEAEMASAVRLSLMDDEYLAAADRSLQRASRYESTYAYRDYIALLHVLGHSSEAWQGFAALEHQYPTSPHIWETTTVGQRLARMADADVVQWTARTDHQLAKSELYGYPVIHLVRSATMDRVPNETLIAAIESMDAPVVTLSDGRAWRAVQRIEGIMLGNRKASRPLQSEAGGWFRAVGPAGVKSFSYFLASKDLGPEPGVPADLILSGPKTRVPTELSLFVRGYRSLVVGDHAEAAHQFRQAAEIYDLAQSAQSFMQPYVAFSLATNGQADVAEKILAPLRGRSPKFDSSLASAVLLAIAGSHDAAETALLEGLNARMFTEDRAIHVEYEYAELLDWLWRTTHEPRYRERALAWAKVNQKLHPWFAWPFALEARLTASKTDRARCIRFAAFLDRDSRWLSEVEGVKVQPSSANPFLDAISQSSTRTST
jgi:tetratricopeptide (TPR) repeat protein